MNKKKIRNEELDKIIANSKRLAEQSRQMLDRHYSETRNEKVIIRRPKPPEVEK
jgi:hypothetical protein